MEVEKEIRDFIGENFLFGNPEKLPDNDSFLERGLIDSTCVLEVVSFIEGKFNLTVADDELVPENLDSIRRLINFVNRKKALGV
jgi:acyl carrier protein